MFYAKLVNSSLKGEHALAFQVDAFLSIFVFLPFISSLQIKTAEFFSTIVN